MLQKMHTYNTKNHVEALQSFKISHWLKQIQWIFPEDDLNSLILDKMKEIVKSKDIKIINYSIYLSRRKT